MESTAQSPAPTPREPASPTPLEREGDAPSAFSLAAGTYITQSFEPTTTFTLDRAGWLLLQDEPDIFLLGYQPDAEIAFLAPSKIYDPRTGQLERTPDDIGSWIAQHSALRTEEAAAMRVGDTEAMAIEARVASSPPGHPCPRAGGFGSERSRCVAITPLGGDPEQPYVVFAGDRLRFLVTQAEGKTLVITIAAPAGLQFDDFVEAGPMLETVRFS